MRKELLFSYMVHKELSLTKNIKFYCLYKYVQMLVFLAIKIPWMIVVEQLMNASIMFKC